MISGPKFQIMLMPLNPDPTARNNAMNNTRRGSGFNGYDSKPLSSDTAAAISEPLIRFNTACASSR